MTDSIKSVSSLDESPSAQQSYDLSNLSNGSAAEEIRGSNFGELAEGALTNALKEIGKNDSVSASRDELTGQAPNAVNEFKDGVLSDVARPGSEVATENTAEETLQAVEGRAKNLYGEMMVHHIAWGVAQRMQKDMSQLLRGS